jgi:hypothetical protein
MKYKILFFVFFFLCFVLSFTAACKKAEEQQKPGVSTAAPSPQSSPVTEDKSVPTAGKEPPSASVPIPDKTGVPTAETEKAAPDVPPAAPDIPVQSPVSPVKPAGKDIVHVAGFDSPQMSKGAPSGWHLDRRKGTPSVKLEKGSDVYCLQMRSNEQSSFGVKKGIKVDVKEFPYLNWRWKAVQLPNGGDVRKTKTDDQAIQVYVAFTPTGFPATLNTPVVGYIWDNESPKGWTGRSMQIGGGKLKYVVVRNNTDQLGQWYTEKRNIYEDHRKLFKDVKGGDPPTLTHGVQFHINSQNTASTAESYICDVYFSRK